MPPSKPPPRALRKTKLMLLACAASLTACTATLPPCLPESPPLPAPPSMSTPLPQQSYSSSAAQDLQKWQQQLMGTRIFQPPVVQHGQ